MMEHGTLRTAAREPVSLPSLPNATAETGYRRYHLLRNDDEEPSPEGKDESRVQSATHKGGGRYLLCGLCGHRITHTGEGIGVGGSHRHTFANPCGHVFRIGCFRTAPGCRPASTETTDFSWFTGYAWRIQVCANCFSHMGWEFRSEGHGFHGLILERIVEERQNGATE